MASTFSPLKVELIATGEQSGTWGTTTNVNLGTALEEAITGSADVTFASGNVTVTLTDVNTTQTARNLRLNLVGTSSGTHSLILGSGCNIEKLYLVNNTLANDITVVNTAGGSSVTVPAGKSMFIYNTGTNVVDAITHINNASGTFTSLNVTGNTTLGDASADTITLNGTVQPGVVVSGSSSGDAFRITQTGTGNAFVVEDAANPDATPFVIDASGNVIVGYTSTTNYAAFNPNVQSQMASQNAGFAAGNWQNTSGAPNIWLGKSRGAIGTHTIVQSGDGMGNIRFYGSDGTGFIESAAIYSFVDGTPGTNDMPGRLVFSTTADGASSPTERMRIDNQGRIGIGGSTVAGTSLRNIRNIDGGTTSQAFMANGTIQQEVTGGAQIYRSSPATQAQTFTLGALDHFIANPQAFGAGSTVTNQFGFNAASSLTGATNNYGFYSNIASGTGRWNFYANGTAANYFAGNVGIGTTTTTATLNVNGNINLPAATTEVRNIEIGAGRTGNGNSFIDFIGDATFSDYGLRIIRTNTGPNANSDIIHRGIGALNLKAAEAGTIGFLTSNVERMRIGDNGNIGIGSSNQPARTLFVNSPITGATTAWGIVSQGTVQSDVTAQAFLFSTGAFTQATTFTLSNFSHFIANQGTFGAGSTVTNQYGFNVTSAMTGATNNYGFYSNIASGTGRWNFYANGTANNYFNGNVGIGTTTPSEKLRVVGASGSPQFGAGTAGNAVFINSFDSGDLYMTASTVNSTTFGFGSASNIPMFFLTNNTERMRIDTSGNVGIGTSDPTTGARLVINNTAGASAPSLALLNSGNYNAQIGLGVLTGFGDTVGINARQASGLVVFGTNNTERMRIDSSGNVGIGTSSPATDLHIFRSGTTTVASRISNGSVSMQTYVDANFCVTGTITNNPYIIITNNTERMRIDSSGNLLVGTTSSSLGASVNGFAVLGTTSFAQSAPSANANCVLYKPASAAQTAFIFFNTNNTFIASITQNGNSAVAYNTTSDYRLKNDVTPMENALAKVALLKPVNWKWKVDGSHGEGFIAHELSEVIPYAVTGEKDAVNEDGSIKPQGVDTSFLVATLTAAIQELKVELDVVKAELNTLKGN